MNWGSEKDQNSRLKPQGCGLLAVSHRWANVCFFVRRTLAKQFALRINPMIQKTSMCGLIFNSCSVFIVAARSILEAERFYGEQTLASPTLQRSHLFCGVVFMLFVRVKVQGVKSKFLNEKQTSSLYMDQKQNCAQPKQLRLCIWLCCENQDRIP